MTGSAESDEYILGTDDEEITRLRQQHGVWRDAQLELLDRAGPSPGDTAIDLGSGPGYTTFELAERTGPNGRVIARDMSERFLRFLAAECDRRGVRNVETSFGPVEAIELEDESIDVAYSRWLFSWLEDPRATLERVARTLKPGGRFLMQEYLDWGAFGLVPADPAFDRVVDACMRSWAEGGGEIDAARDMPRHAAALGLEVEHFEVRATLARSDEPAWVWLGGFFESYLPRLVERGTLDADACATHLERVKAWIADGSVWLTGPTMADVVLRKPDR